MTEQAAAVSATDRFTAICGKFRVSPQYQSMLLVDYFDVHELFPEISFDEYAKRWAERKKKRFKQRPDKVVTSLRKAMAWELPTQLLWLQGYLEYIESFKQGCNEQFKDELGDMAYNMVPLSLFLQKVCGLKLEEEDAEEQTRGAAAVQADAATAERRDNNAASDGAAEAAEPPAEAGKKGKGKGKKGKKPKQQDLFPEPAAAELPAPPLPAIPAAPLPPPVPPAAAPAPAPAAAAAIPVEAPVVTQPATTPPAAAVSTGHMTPWLNHRIVLAMKDSDAFIGGVLEAVRHSAFDVVTDGGERLYDLVPTNFESISLHSDQSPMPLAVRYGKAIDIVQMPFPAARSQKWSELLWEDYEDDVPDNPAIESCTATFANGDIMRMSLVVSQDKSVYIEAHVETVNGEMLYSQTRDVPTGVWLFGPEGGQERVVNVWRAP